MGFHKNLDDKKALDSEDDFLRSGKIKNFVYLKKLCLLDKKVLNPEEVVGSPYVYKPQAAF